MRDLIILVMILGLCAFIVWYGMEVYECITNTLHNIAGARAVEI